MNSLLDILIPKTQKDILHVVAVAVLYFVVAKLSLYIFYAFNTSPALIWPVVGLGLASVIRGGYKMCLAIFCAQFLALETHTPGLSALPLMVAFGYALQAGCGAYILTKCGFTSELSKLRNILLLVLISFMITMIAPAISTIYQMYFGTLSLEPLANWGRSYGGGIFSVLVFTPAILFWHPWKRSHIPKERSHQIEIFAALGILLIATHLIFWTTLAQILGIAVIFVIPAILIWFALRFHPRWLSFAVVTTSLYGLAGVLLANTSGNQLSDQLIATEVYIGMVAAIFYVFAAVVDERRMAFIRLSEAFNMTKAADKSKNEFIAILAHELRNPLAPVITSLELLKTKSNDPEIIKIIEGASVHTLMMRRLLDDLLDIARLGQNKVQLHKETISIKQVIQQSLASAQEKANDLHHTITLHIPEKDFLFFADPVRIKQIIINLLNNALKYTQEGGKIELNCFKEDEFLIIKVHDTGIGIAKDKLEHIFEPFKQLGSASRYSSGLGIGLFLTKQLVELHGGTILAESAGTEKGSTFTVRIPLHTSLANASPLKVAPVDTELTRTKILVVDDNESAANILEKLLRIKGHDAAAAYSGAQALEKVAAWNPEVVLLDIGMPGMDGYEAAKRIRQTSWGGILIALSGFGQQTDKARSLEAGFNHHLVKPAGINDILDIIAQLQK